MATVPQSLFSIFRCCALSLASLYVGFYWGYQQGVAHTSLLFNGINLDVDNPEYFYNHKYQDHKEPTPINIFPPTTESFVTAMSLVDTGVPLFHSHEFNRQVLLLHANRAMPPNSSTNHVNQLSVDVATQNCNYLSLVLTQPERQDQCIAIMGQYNSYHISKFMRIRIKTNSSKIYIDNSQPLQLVKRGADSKSFTTKTPKPQVTQKYWQTTLQPYLANLQTYLDKLRPIAQQVAVDNTIIVMVSNYGHSELLVNFVCHAKQRTLDLSMILVFATDIETYHLSLSLGLTTFFHDQLFAQIPKQHAIKFGDSTYKNTIFSKLYCVHLVGLLGYNYLFQDVDLVWYKHPLDFFRQPKLPFHNDYEIYMQNDGNYAQFYAPYSGNTGFYYVKNTRTTQVSNQLHTALVSEIACQSPPFRMPRVGFLPILTHCGFLSTLPYAVLYEPLFGQRRSHSFYLHPPSSIYLPTE
jgi:Nucleotide-diphospho-sugar transferase